MNQPSPGQFLEACEATAPLQFLIEHAKRREIVRRTLPLPFAVVGYDKRTELALDDGGGISRRHAYLQMVAGRLWCVDLNSRSGTLFDPPGGTPGLLDRRRSIRIGPYTIRVAAGSREDGDDSPPPNPFSSNIATSSFPRIGLEVSQGGARQPMRLVDRVLTLIGRSAHCRLLLNHRTVSRTHCALLHTPAGFWLIDLLGRDGTRVNGVPVRWALLEDGDEVHVGQFLLRVHVLKRSGTETAPNLLPAPSSAPALLLRGGLPVEVNGMLTSALQLPVAGGGGTNESMLLPLITQFSLMTQQMFDQFQQALMMMVQTFSRLHHDQLHLIRQELKQLHGLTRELQEIQKELRNRPPDPPRTTAAPADTAKASLPPTPPAPSMPRPAEPARPRTAPLAEANTDTPTAPPLRPTAEVHAWLTQRLAVLQEERQTRWQKILHALTGTSGEEAMP